MDAVNTSAFLDDTEIALLKRTLLKDFTEDEQETFVRTCQRTRLDPFTKQIYATKRAQTQYVDGQKIRVPTLVIVSGIHGLTAVADRTGNYDGCEIFWCDEDGVWKAEWIAEPNHYPIASKAVIYHKQRKYPEVSIAIWESYVGKNYNGEVSEFWARMGAYMLAKCAKAGGLRGAFPDQTGGLYVSEELDRDEHPSQKPPAPKAVLEHASNVVPITPAPTPDAEETRLRAEAKNLPPRGHESTAPPPSSPTQTVAQGNDSGPQQPAQVPVVPATGEPGAGPAPDPVPEWREHVITGIKDVRYFNRKVKSLTDSELHKLVNQWVNKVTARWDEASEEQRADAEALKAAFSAKNVEKPY